MNRVKQLRKALGLTTRALAPLVNLDNVTISNIENGKRSLRDDDIPRFMAVFDCTSDYLLGLSDQKNPPKSYECVSEEEQRLLDIVNMMPYECKKELKSFIDYLKSKYAIDTEKKDDSLDIIRW